MDPIVGDDDCKIIQVCNLLAKLASYELIIAKLNDIALNLGVPSEDRQRIKNGLKLSTTTSFEALNEILASWRSSFSCEAKLSVFLNVLQEGGLSQAADALRENFACGRSPMQRQYQCPPTGFENFLNSHHKLLVISTLDKNVTTSKLMDNTSCIHTNDCSQFMNKLQQGSDKKLYSFESNDDVADVLDLIASAVKYKAVIITKENLKASNKPGEGMMFVQDTFEWSHLLPSYQLVLVDKIIKISGKRMPLREFRKQVEGQNKEMPSGQHLIDIINDNEPNLDKSSIPNPNPASYYVPRRISPRKLLNPNSLFGMVNEEDKFMISGIGQVELSKYAGPEVTDTSTNQIRMRDPKAATHIILDTKSGQINTIQRALESKNDQAEYSEQNVLDLDCKIIQVCNLLARLPSYELIIAKLNDIALTLGVPTEDRQRIKNGLKLSTGTPFEAINEILAAWRSTFSCEAMLSALLQVLGECGLSDATDGLRENFAWGRSPTQQRYQCPPTGFENFLNSYHKLLVISTLDKSVTESKLRDTFSCIHINDRFEFVDKLQLVSAADKKMYSLECNDNFNLADALDFITTSAVKYKAVIITEEKFNTLGEIYTKPKEGILFFEDEFEWTYLTLPYQLVVAEKFIKISGKRMTLREFRKKIRHLTDEMPSGQHLLDIINDKEPNLDKNTIPPCVSYYVPRRISPRSLLNPGTIFNMMKDDDKFMISGIDQLSKYAGPEVTDTSTNQKRMRYPKAATYIILDTESDFDEISKQSSAPSHWIRHDKGQFSWMRSSGQINRIQTALESKNDQAKYSEEIFLDLPKFKTKNKTHVVISDTPGMGKSQLLSSLAGRLQSKGKIVLFGAIPAILKALKPSLEEGKEIKPVLLDILSNLGEQSRSVSKYLRQALNTGNDHINVMLDGLDEIDSGDLNLAKTVLTTINTLQSVRMWTTTPPQYLETLEKWLQVLGHTIHPFNSKDQLNCITRYWQQIGAKNLDGKRLLEHRLNGLAKTCLDTLQLCIRSKDWDIAGIPLQCMLLAEVFEREARNYANPDIQDSDAVPPPINIRSITELYTRLVEKKLDTYFERIPSSKYSKEQIKHTHMVLAVKFLFPEWVDEAQNLMGPNFELVKSEDMLNVGFMEKCHSENESNFIHRTIPEYFAADFAVQVINEGSGNQSACKIMEAVLECTHHDATVNFELASFGTRRSYSRKMTISSHKFMHEVVVYFIDNLIQPKMLLWHINISIGMVNSCVTGNFVNIFSHLSKSSQFQDCLQTSISPEHVVLSVMYSDLSIVEIICGMYTNYSLIIIPYSHLNDENMGNEKSWLRSSVYPTKTTVQDVTLLHLAVRFREYKLVEYLVHSQGFRELLTNNRLKGLVYYCLHNSCQNNESVIREKVLILRFLRRHFPRQIHSASGHFLAEPLLIGKVHVVLLCELITLGADVFVTDKCGTSILEHTALYLNSKDYHKFLSHIPFESTSILVQIRNSRLHWILKYTPVELEPESYIIFKNAGTDFSGEFGTSLLKCAIEGGKGIITFEQLVMHGATWQATNQKVWTLLHMAMAYLRFPAFQYFATKFTDDVCLRQQILEAQRWSDLHHVDFGLLRIDINAQDSRGRTIMHHLSSFNYKRDDETEIEVMKLLLQKGADIHIRNAKGHTVIENSVFCQRDVIQLQLLETHGAIQTRQMAIRVVKAIEKEISQYPSYEEVYRGFANKIIKKWNLDFYDLSVFGGHKCVVQ